MNANRTAARPLDRPILYFSTGIFPKPDGNLYYCSPALPTPATATADEGWTDLNYLLDVAREETETDRFFELGFDELPSPLADIRGHIEGEPERVFAWINCDGEPRYFGISAVPLARRKISRAETQLAGGYTFDYGYLAEDFDPAHLVESHGHYRLAVAIPDRDPSSEEVHTWVLTIPAEHLTPRRRARLRPLAEVLFVAPLFPSGYDPFDEDPDVPYDRDGLRADVVRFAVVTARRRARTRYVRHWRED